MPGRLADALAAYVKAVAAARKQHQGHIPFDGNDAAAVAAASGRCLNEVDQEIE